MRGVGRPRGEGGEGGEGAGDVAEGTHGAMARETAREMAAVRGEAGGAGLVAMPVQDQMRFHWAFIQAGLGVVEEAAGGRPAGGLRSAGG